nr:tetratricopeptide repeat protein [uncultured Desulfuromonas sp.]
MSLINQMLRDLEERRRKEAPQGADVAAVTVPRKRRPLGMITAIVLAALAGGVLLWWVMAPPRTRPQPVAHTVQDTLPPIAAEIKPANPVHLLSMRGSERGRELRIVLELSEAVAWGIIGQDAHSLTLTLPVAVQTTLDSQALTLLSSWRVVPRQGNSELAFLADREMRWNVFALDTDSQHGWRLVVEGNATDEAEVADLVVPVIPAEDHAAETVLNEVVPKSTVTEMSSQQAAQSEVKKQLTPRDQLWHQAQAAVQEKDLENAARLLTELVTVDPEDRQGRLELTRILLQQGDAQQALVVAEQGHRIQPAEPLWLIFKARLLAEANQLPQALDALTVENPPSVRQNPKFYALKAALLQRAARYDEALLEYRQLCGVFPQQAQWWLGRAVSAEQLAMRDEARQSFKRALALPGLEASLQQYAVQQLTRLGEVD